MNATSRAAAGHYAHVPLPGGAEAVNAGARYNQGPVAQNGMAQINDPLGGVVGQFAAMSLPGGPIGQAGQVVPQLGPNPAYIVPGDGQIYLTGYAPAAHAIGAAGITENAYGTFPVQYVPQGSYAPAYAPFPVVPFTPGRNGVSSDRSDRRDVPLPGLENRRGSYSTNDSAPATPFYGGVNHRDPGTRVAVVDRSAYTTPSPQQLAVNGMIGQPVPKAIPDRALELRLDALLKQNPEIPKAIPAVFTQPHQIKTVEQCLDSRIEGNRNVYIRGLHPTTDDETLYHYASRFGKVETSKAIIDTATGACKG